MTKKLTVIACLILLISAICGCAPQSEYDSLTAYQKGIVDNVLAHESSFSNCNGVKFGAYNGDTYFVASRTVYSSSSAGLSGAGHVKETHYFIVTDSSFLEVDWDPYSSITAYGAVYEWDDSWDIETKKEKLAIIIN